MSLSFLFLVACASPAPTARPAPAPAVPRDPASHGVQLVPVAKDVALEVLDFGGQGPPLVLLAGLGNSGHVFDDLAPALTGTHHVWAITRRGYGASTHAADGYDTATRVADDLAVADALHWGKAIWVGHSIAGGELTLLGGQHAERVAGLVYLDAAFDHQAIGKMLEHMPEPPQPEPTPEELHDFARFHDFLSRSNGVTFPVGEVLAAFEFDEHGALVKPRNDGEAMGKILAGTIHPDYDAVKVPALALFASPATADELCPHLETLSSEQQAACRSFTADFNAFRTGQLELVRTHLAGVEMRELAHAHHYVFFSNRDEVLAALRSFP